MAVITTSGDLSDFTIIRPFGHCQELLVDHIAWPDRDGRAEAAHKRFRMIEQPPHPLGRSPEVLAMSLRQNRERRVRAQRGGIFDREP
jgi:hypothetical protein